MGSKPGGLEIRDRRILLPVLLAVALVLSLVVPAAVAGASGSELLLNEWPVNYLVADNPSPVSTPSLNIPRGNVTAIVGAGERHTVGLKADGTVVAVGYCYDGQCGVSGWANITQVTAGGWNTVGLKVDGTVVAGGRSITHRDVDNWTDIVQIAAGGVHVVGLRTDGTVVAAGGNSYGQCDVGNWTDIAQVTAGDRYTVGLKVDGTVVAVGSNNSGQCNVSGWTDITQVDAGDAHTVGLKSHGTVVAVGSNGSGQCNVRGWTDITQVDAGDVHTVGIKVDGTVVAVGFGERCDVDGWTNIVQVAAGGFHTVGVKTDGTVVAVGETHNGQCDVYGWKLLFLVLTIHSSAGGTVTTPVEGSLDYDYGTIVDLVAEPEEGYRFANWTGEVSTVGNISAASTNINMRGDCSITANFEQTPLFRWALIGVFIALIAGLVIFFVRRRRLTRIGCESKIWGFLRRPVATFGQVEGETLGVALKYALIGLLIFGVLAGIMLAPLWSIGLSDLFELFELDIGWLPNNPLLLIAAVIGFSVVGGMILIFIGGAWLHLWVYIFGGRRGHGYRQTLKALIYGATPIYTVGWVPFIGGVIGSIWAIVLAIIGLRELHGITTDRAVGASLLAIGISTIGAMLLTSLLALSAWLAPVGGLAFLAELPSLMYTGIFLLLFWVALFAFFGG